MNTVLLFLRIGIDGLLKTESSRKLNDRISAHSDRISLDQVMINPSDLHIGCNLNHNEYTGDILERIEQWVDYKERKINEMREINELQFQDTHTFKPKIKKFSRSKSKKCFEPKHLSR